MEETRMLFAFVKAIAPVGETWHVNGVTSDDTIDREDEILDPAGWLLRNYHRNPTILACHQHRLVDGRSPVVGRAPETCVREKLLDQKIQFAWDPETHKGTDLGEEYHYHYTEKMMCAFSVGFAPLEGHFEEVKQDGKLVRIYRHTRMELYEASCVPVGANPAALARGLKALTSPAASGADVEYLKDLCRDFREQVEAFKKEAAEIRDLVACLLPDTVNPPASPASPAGGGAGEDAGREAKGRSAALAGAAEAIRRAVTRLKGKGSRKDAKKNSDSFFQKDSSVAVLCGFA